ncbi:MAG: GNAT family N-acetyltransferase [Deltaproteobacteria bacterium]|nr:GNAT family N-acetyltransferase [Deltaproteobacteria bacterium]
MLDVDPFFGKSVPALKHDQEDRLKGVAFRYEVLPKDVEDVRALVEKTGFFRVDEISVAAELVAERLNRGPESAYYFVLSEEGSRLSGYVCYGPIPCTIGSYDLYWIAVDPTFQGKGLGRSLLHEAERLIREMGGTRIYVETSSRGQYVSTRIFYERCGYMLASVLDDFYGPDDSKAIFLKVLTSSTG